MRGTVTSVSPERGFGFIGGDGQEFFFHRNALLGVEFEQLAPGVDVIFEVDDNPEGDRPGEHPRAVNIRLAEYAAPAVDNEVLPPEKAP